MGEIRREMWVCEIYAQCGRAPGSGLGSAPSAGTAPVSARPHSARHPCQGRSASPEGRSLPLTSFLGTLFPDPAQGPCRIARVPPTRVTPCPHCARRGRSAARAGQRHHCRRLSCLPPVHLLSCMPLLLGGMHRHRRHRRHQSTLHHASGTSHGTTAKCAQVVCG